MGDCLRAICGYGPISVPAELMDTRLLEGVGSSENDTCGKFSSAPVCVAAFLGVAALLTPADARRAGGVHISGGGHVARAGTVNRNWSANRDINRSISRNVEREPEHQPQRQRNVNVNRTYAYRNGRRGYWRNGVWIVAPAVAGATYVASCGYQYSRWQATGSTYWRDRTISARTATERRAQLRACPRMRAFGPDWCCRTGLNCRPLPYQGSALPLSYGSEPRAPAGGPPEGADMP